MLLAYENNYYVISQKEIFRKSNEKGLNRNPKWIK